MLRRFTGKRRRLPFVAYDLEWIPGEMTERLCGIYDGKEYRSYPTTLEFLRGELTHRNRGKIFFAHAGGLADVQFVLAEIIKRGNPYFRVEGSFSGSSLIICRIKAGHNTWSFVDSYWLLRDSLAKIGASLGLEKGGADYFCPDYPSCGHPHEGKPTCIYYAPMAILRDYNALDCRILYSAIERLEDEVWMLGGELRSTIASTAMFLFRASFLTRDIATQHHVNEVGRQAYAASRVEVFRRECQEADYFDINSSFPWSMTKPQPAELTGTSKRFREGSRCVLVNAEVTVPEVHIPPAPMKFDHRVYFPVGRFQSWFAGEDLELILECGGRIERVNEVLHFAEFDDLAAYVMTVYEMRRRATDPFQRLVYKYLMNSLYGKFGEGSLKMGLLINPKKRPKASEIKHVYRAGVYLIEKEVEVKHAHVPIAVNITASSRALITRFLWSAQGEVYYCDTDSLVTTDATLPVGDQLGQLKHEKHIEKGMFLAPKLYRLHPGPTIRAKGFRKLSDQEFDSLARGETVAIERMERIRENFKNNIFEPREKSFVKRTTSHLSYEELTELGLSTTRLVRPKRRTESDGSTSPWNYADLARDDTSLGSLDYEELAFG